MSIFLYFNKLIEKYLIADIVGRNFNEISIENAMMFHKGNEYYFFFTFLFVL